MISLWVPQISINLSLQKNIFISNLTEHNLTQDTKISFLFFLAQSTSIDSHSNEVVITITAILKIQKQIGSK